MNFYLSILLCAALLPASSEKERHLRLQYDNLAAQAQALIETVDEMKSSLQQQGLVLHPEIAAARNHLATAMDRASEALEKHDWTGLRRDLDRARGWLERLRRRL